MIKVAMIGAGSIVFSKNLTGDILGYPELADSTMCYMDIDKDRLEVGVNLCRKVAKALGASPKIEGTLDRRRALDGADFVINMVQIGGFDSTLVDFEIPRKYGLNFTIADTTGPGGLFRALRTFPMLRDMCRDMEELCPKAVLINYSNPMSMNMQTIWRTSSITGVGLCHSVQGTFDWLMRTIGERPEDCSFVCAGVNHMAFYLRLEKNGVDLYPRLFALLDDPRSGADRQVRFELMKRLGYYCSESDEHSSEYNPYFIPHGREMIARYRIPIDEYLRRCDAIVDEFERLKVQSKTDEPLPVHRSNEYGSTIIHSMVTGRPSVVYGNMPNTGAISNLPRTAIVEAPTLVDRTGVHHVCVGELPPQLVAYIQPHVAQHELFIRAALEGRRDYVYQAAMFDPLTAATLPLDRIVEMCDEMIAAHGDLLPRLEKKSLVPTSGKTFGAVDPKALRAQWDAVQAKAAEGYIQEWYVAGPFRTDTPGAVTLDLRTPVDDELARRGDGSVDLEAGYGTAGALVKWRKCRADKRGQVDLVALFGPVEWAVAFAYAEIRSEREREVIARCGSDDGIRVWVNGRQVHSHEIGRAYSPNADEFPARLRAGTNRILVKVDNYVGGWGFGLMVPKD